MEDPLVSVVCLCYNQSGFVKEAIESVLAQTYKYIQLIVVDDASTDNSAGIIREMVSANPSLQTVLLKENVGNCAAFNRALPLVRGDFVIDFAADDVMMPERIDRQVKSFSSLDESYGVVFTDAVYINAKGEYLRDHYGYLFRKGLLSAIPQGDVYRNVLATYFIASPTMMVRTKVMEVLGGYDENLSYEDFDFWVRSSRIFKYAFLNEKLTKIRRIIRSMSSGWYKQGDRQLHATYLVCKKAMLLNRSEQDRVALTKRLKFELRQSVFSENRHEAVLFYELLKETGYAGTLDRILFNVNKLHLPLSFLRRWYHRLRFGEV